MRIKKELDQTFVFTILQFLMMQQHFLYPIHNERGGKIKNIISWTHNYAICSHDNS
jgi:hypothetical protein